MHNNTEVETSIENIKDQFHKPYMCLKHAEKYNKIKNIYNTNSIAPTN